MDRQTRENSCEKLRETVKEKNLAVIFATNNYDEVFSICDRVSILHNGTIIQTGTPREVYEHPHSSAAARVTGRNNLIKAKRLNSDNSKMPEFQTITGEHRLFTDIIDENSFGAIDENVTLAIRPKHISISFGASFPEDNLIKAKITNVVFKGDTTLIMLDANGLKARSDGFALRRSEHRRRMYGRTSARQNSGFERIKNSNFSEENYEYEKVLFGVYLCDIADCSGLLRTNSNSANREKTINCGFEGKCSRAPRRARNSIYRSEIGRRFVFSRKVM